MKLSQNNSSTTIIPERVVMSTFTQSKSDVPLDKKSEAYFSSVYNNYYKAIYKVVNQIISNTYDAQDATQISFIKVAKYISDYDSSKGLLYTWIAKIARNTSLDILRSSAYKKDLATESLTEHFSEHKFPVFQTSSLDLTGLFAMMTRLTPKERAITDLLYFKGYTQAEAAVELDMPLGTVKGLSRSSIMKFRRMCANEIRYLSKM
jgi:RNA polymerase sigma-70 factor (ECF subfamily)